MIPLVGFLASCGSSDAKSPEKTSSSESQIEHVHNFSQKNTDPKYLASEADCTSPAKYYYSCECGEAGTETFEYGSPLEHSLNAEALPQYLKTPATCTSDAVYYLHCENCDFISEETFENIGTKLGHTYNPITGSCINECGETIALQETINYGDGSFKNIESSAVIASAERNKEFIFDFQLKGNENVPTTNITFRPIYGDAGSAVYYSNLSFVAYNDKCEYIDVNRLTTAVYSLEDNFANGSHIYVHAKVNGTDFTDFRFEISTHQYTGLKLVAPKNATCISPRVGQHIAFDQSEATDTWLDPYVREEKTKESFVSGSGGTGHSMTHYAATDATATSPAFKEHWYCENCGGYYLTEGGEEEVTYEALYANTLYGTVQSYYAVTGRGSAFKARLIVDNGEFPIEANDARYVGKTLHVILADASEITSLAVAVEVNLHVVEILLRGVTWSDSAAPKAFYFNA